MLNFLTGPLNVVFFAAHCTSCSRRCMGVGLSILYSDGWKILLEKWELWERGVWVFNILGVCCRHLSYDTKGYHHHLHLCSAANSCVRLTWIYQDKLFFSPGSFAGSTEALQQFWGSLSGLSMFLLFQTSSKFVFQRDGNSWYIYIHTPIYVYI